MENNNIKSELKKRGRPKKVEVIRPLLNPDDPYVVIYEIIDFIKEQQIKKKKGTKRTSKMMKLKSWKNIKMFTKRCLYI